MKRILITTALCSWFGAAHAMPFPDTFVTEEEAAPSAVILSVETDADGVEMSASAEARGVDAAKLDAGNVASIDPEALFDSGQALTARADEDSPEARVPVPILLLPSIITVTGRAAAGRYSSYSRHGNWHRPYRNYYYYHRCGRSHRCR